MHRAVICGGGAGDVIREMFWDGWYQGLDLMAPDDSCDIYIVSHSPFVGELFQWHPRASQIRVHSLGYWCPDEDSDKRREYGVPQDGDYEPMLRGTGPIEFYPSPQDEEIFDYRLSDWRHPFDNLPNTDYIVYACGAGTMDRAISSVTQKQIRQVTSRINGCFDVAVGRSYERGDGRWEPDMSVDLDLVDDLSLAGVCHLAQGSSGIVCSHSALSMLAFLIHKPQLLLYPEEVRQRHFLQPDMWSFGASSPEVVHGTFEDFEKNGTEMVDRFLQAMKVGSK